MSRRKIAVVTGSRADYGLLRWIMGAIAESDALALSVIATGMHFAPDLGSTWQAIERDGFTIDERVDMLLVGDSAETMAKSVGVGVLGFTEAFKRARPDVVLVLGDRFEVFSAASAAMLLSIPIAHVHGGEVTEGAVDESIRHAITKMAHLHFASAAPHKARIEQMGEDPAHVFNVGAPGVEGISRLELLSREELARALGTELSSTLFAVTYHPVTLGDEGVERPVRALLAALDRFPEATVVCTRANADPEGRAINALLDEHASKRSGRVHVFASLGQLRYLSLVRHARAVIGNSSSGLIEAPYLRVPTVNIGLRQSGRLRGETVIDCGDHEGQIVEAIERALSPSFSAVVSNATSPYGNGDTSRQVVSVLSSVDLRALKRKRFFDVAR